MEPTEPGLTQASRPWLDRQDFKEEKNQFLRKHCGGRNTAGVRGVAPGHGTPLVPQGRSRVDTSPQGPSLLACAMLWGFGGESEGTGQHQPPCTAPLNAAGLGSRSHPATAVPRNLHLEGLMYILYIRAQFPPQTRDTSGCLLQLTCLFLLLGFCPGL